MRTKRLLLLTLLVTPVAFTPALGAGVARAAVDGPGAAVLGLRFEYDTPIQPGECVEATHSVTGSLDGAFLLGGSPVVARLSLSGTGGSWFPGNCFSVQTGTHLVDADAVGTTVDGRAIDCDLAFGLSRALAFAPGSARGTCSIDGAGSYALNGSFAGAVTSTPVEASANRAPLEATTIEAPFLQHVPPVCC